MDDVNATIQNDLQHELIETRKRMELLLESRQQLIGKLKQARRDYLAIFDSVPAMIWYRDHAGRILKANQSAADSVGMSVRDLTGKNYYELFPDGAERARQRDLEVIETGRPLRGQLRPFTGRNGLERWATADRIPLRDKEGRITGVMVFAMDITDKKRAEDELIAAKNKIEQTNRRLKATIEQANLLAEKATRSNRVKSELLASSSHDLRSPMNSIIGFAEILMDTALDDEQKEYAKTIHRAANGLLLLINDILDFSRIEANKLKIEIVSCAIDDIIEEIRAMMENSARKKGLDFHVETDSRLPKTFFTDPLRLKQCLINLVGNAVKFTESGYVSLSVRLEDRAGQTCIRFDVEDTGIGIKQDKQDVIFKSYSQADASTSRKYGGTGLGLTISRRLAGLLGGDIRLKSEFGKGSVFSLILPLFIENRNADGSICIGARPAQRISDSAGEFTGRILLVEKSFPSQLAMTLMLRRFGPDVELVGSLEQALERLETHPFDLVFVDAGMGKDQTAAFMKKMPPNSTQTPVILVADQDEYTMKDCLQAGFADCVHRPLLRNQVYDTIARHLPDKAAGEDAVAPHEDDSADNIASVESILKRLPELAGGIRDVLYESDIDLVTRFAELFSEIGQTVGQTALSEKASEILDCTEQFPASEERLVILVEQLCRLCEQIHETTQTVNPQS